MTYREGDLTERFEKRFGDIEARMGSLEVSRATFRERWAARAAWAREMVFPAIITIVLAVCGAVLVLGFRGCEAIYAEERASAGVRCSAVCEALGMHGSALEGPRSGDGTIRMDCYCGLGTRLVSIHRDGSVVGIDTATGVVTGSSTPP